MRKIIMIAVLLNVFLILFFILSNLAIWNTLNGYELLQGSWSPLSINYFERAQVGGPPLATGGGLFSPNLPFWLFFISTAINLYLIIRLQKTKKGN